MLTTSTMLWGPAFHLTAKDSGLTSNLREKISTGIPTPRTAIGVYFTNQEKAYALNSQLSSVFTRDDEVQPYDGSITLFAYK